jgi:hypothetical protein
MCRVATSTKQIQSLIEKTQCVNPMNNLSVAYFGTLKSTMSLNVNSLSLIGCWRKKIKLKSQSVPIMAQALRFLFS